MQRALLEVGTRSEEERCQLRCTYLLWCACGPDKPCTCIYPSGHVGPCRCFLCYSQARFSKLQKMHGAADSSSHSPRQAHIAEQRLATSIAAGDGMVDASMVEFARNHFEECRGCMRIMWPTTTCMSMTEASLKLDELIKPQSYQYIGVTFSPLYRMHLIRNAEGIHASHFPLRWRTMYVVAVGSRTDILDLEKFSIKRHAKWLANSARAGGTGTAQPILFIYVCKNDGPDCYCSYCRDGNTMEATEATEGIEPLGPQKRMRLGLRAAD